MISPTERMIARERRRDRLDDLQQSRAAQRAVARHVGRRCRVDPRSVRAAIPRSASSCSTAPATRPSSPAPTFREFEKQRARTRTHRATTTPSTEAANAAARSSIRKPTIAMIQGYLHRRRRRRRLQCDMRIAAENSRFAVPAARLGLGYRWARRQEAGRPGRPRPSPRRSSSPRASSPPPRRSRWA